MSDFTGRTKVVWGAVFHIGFDEIWDLNGGEGRSGVKTEASRKCSSIFNVIITLHCCQRQELDSIIHNSIPVKSGGLLSSLSLVLCYLDCEMSFDTSTR